MRKFFEGFDFAVSNAAAASNGTAKTGVTIPSSQLDKEFAVYKLILAYRRKGHLIAKTNPIRERKDRQANLSLADFGLGEADLSSAFAAGQIIGLPNATLKDILAFLNTCYTGHVGVQVAYITDRKKQEWLFNEIENTLLKPVPLQQKKEYCRN
ncbi:MAG: hypothetical protein R2765_12405 [Ferruginibacter sp.]